MASGYSNGAVVPAWTFDAMAGAGAVVSSANDLMEFIQSNFQADASGVGRAIVATQQRASKGTRPPLPGTLTRTATGTRFTGTTAAQAGTPVFWR